MSEVHVTVGNNVVFHNPAQHPLAPNAGVPVVVAKDSSGKTTSAKGQVTGTGTVLNNPA